jgi:hypothetical protein
MTTKKPLTHKDGVANLVRPLYAPGLLLEDTDLTTAVDYTRNALQLAMRSLFGCGVICGLGISAKSIMNGCQVQIVVGAGVALDCLGNLIHVPKDVTLVYDPKCEPMKSELWVEVCYTTCESKPGSTSCSEEDSLTSTNRRSRDAYAIRVWDTRPRCACSCAPDDPEGGDSDPNNCCGSVTVTTTVESSCCGQEQTATTTTSTTPSPAPGTSAPATGTQQPTASAACACYEDHNNGICGCDCGGNCVLLGKLEIPDSGDVWTAEVQTLRRFVRPMLLGSKDCYCEQCRPADPQQPVPSFVESAHGYSGLQGANALRSARSALLATEEAQYATRLQLARVSTDLAGMNAEITRLEKVTKDTNAAAEAKVAAQEMLEKVRLRVPELEAAKDRVAKRFDAHQAELDLGEKRIARLSIDRNIAAHQQELAYIDERILQRTGGKDAVLSKQREVALEALKGEMEKLTKLK